MEFKYCFLNGKNKLCITSDRVPADCCKVYKTFCLRTKSNGKVDIMNKDFFEKIEKLSLSKTHKYMYAYLYGIEYIIPFDSTSKYNIESRYFDYLIDRFKRP